MQLLFPSCQMDVSGICGLAALPLRAIPSKMISAEIYISSHFPTRILPMGDEVMVVEYSILITSEIGLQLA